MPVANTTIKITDQASAALRNINIALSATVHGTENLQAALDRNTAALNNFRTGANAAANSQNRVNATARSGSGIFSGLVGRLGALAAAYISVQTAQKFMAETDAYIGNQARINIMNDGLQTNKELYDKIYASAQRSLAPINDVAASVTKLGIVAKDAFKSNDEIIAFTEIFNKAATVSGSSTSEKSNAMYQLSQAFASGRLQGDELRSVRENAPMLFKAIQKELEKQYGEGVDFKKLAADGLISPQVIKNAAFASKKEIDAAFKNMPMSFGDMFTQAENKIKKSMETIFRDTQNWLNTPAIKKAINTITNIAIHAIHFISATMRVLFSSAVLLAKGIWALKYPILGVAGAILLYNVYTKGAIALAAIHRAWIFSKALAMTLFAIATGKATTAQIALNLAALKFMLIAALIIAIVAIVAYNVIQNLDFIMGGLYWLWAAIQNGVKHISNWMLWVAEVAINAWNTVYNTVSKLWLNLKLAFNKFMIGIYSIALTITEKIGGAFEKMINPVIAAINKAIQLASHLPGLGKLANMKIEEYSAAKSAEKQKAAIASLYKNNATIEAEIAKLNKPLEKANLGRNTDFIDKSAEFQKGFARGGDLTKSINGGFGKFKDSIFGKSDDKLDSEYGAVGVRGDNPLMKDIAKNTEQTAKNTAKQEEDYKMIRDVMAQRAVSRLGSTGGTVKVDMTNNNSINSNLDFRGWIAKLAHTMEEAASTTAKGIHN